MILRTCRYDHRLGFDDDKIDEVTPLKTTTL